MSPKVGLFCKSKILNVKVKKLVINMGWGDKQKTSLREGVKKTKFTDWSVNQNSFLEKRKRCRMLLNGKISIL